MKKADYIIVIDVDEGASVCELKETRIVDGNEISIYKQQDYFHSLNDALKEFEQ